MNNNHFDYAENTIDAKRSTFYKNVTNLGTCNLGEIIPYYVEEVYPGDTINLETASIIRTGALISPIYANLYLDIYYFFTPNRLLWNHWAQFLGENDTSAWTENTEYQIPQAKKKGITNPNSLLSYMQGFSDNLGEAYNPGTNLSELPLRAYYLIYNEWFRNQAFEAPVLFTKEDTGNETINYNDKPKIANKFRDYYTSILPEPQKGEPVQLPLGNYAPINAKEDLITTFTTPPRLYKKDTLSQGDEYSLGSNENGFITYITEDGAATSTNEFIDTTNLIADLSKATAATIESLRVAYATQRYLERDALFGTRMDEIVQSHFGVNNGANNKYIPEYLTGERIRLNIDQVLATAQTGENNSIQNPQGNVAGWSCTGNISEGFTKSFVEHGWIMGIAVIRQEETYANTISKSFTRLNKLDFYWPEFANIGEQPIMKSEAGLIYQGQEDEIFGYQEAWAELRYGKNIVSGLLNPKASNNIGYWTLAENINKGQAEFIKADKIQLDRALAVTSEASGAQFIFDITAKAKWTRILPLYSDPSIIDKH